LLEKPMSQPFTCTVHKLAPGAYEALQEWKKVVTELEEDAVEAIRDEGISLELTILDRREDGDYLLFIMRTDDYDRAVRVFEQSRRPVDNYHRQFLDTYSLGSRKMEVLTCNEA
jgi:hypothetical protein